MCCNDFGHCTRGDDCCARAADEQVTLPPHEPQEPQPTAPIDQFEPLSLGEKVFVVALVLIASCTSVGLILAGAYHLLPRGIA